MSAVRHAVIRADASSSIGGGHAMRCLALADALSAEGWTVTFATTPETVQTVPALRRAGHTCVSLADAKVPGALREALPGGCDLLVVDHYGLDAAYESDCRQIARKILVIDDLADRDHDCDVLVDPTLGRDGRAYRDRVPSTAQIATGPMYAPLRPFFFTARGERRAAGDKPRRVLLSMGATDAGERLLPLLKALAHLPASIDVVVGSSARHLADIRAAAGKSGAHIYVDTPDMAKLMAEADIAVLAAGTTTWEAACVGLAIVLMVTADNQVEVARSMKNAGAAVDAESVDDAASAVSRLLSDRDARSTLSRAASFVCDGLGARRIAILVAPEHDSEGCAITLRPATFADSDLILHWQQHPDTRRYSRNPVPPTRAKHEAWMARKLADFRSLLQIVMRDNAAAGFIRLDRGEHIDGYEVSIVTAPGQGRRGIGAAALKLARRLLPESTIRAFVMPENRISLRLFEKAGYKSVGDNWYVQQPTAMMAVTA